ncbi:MAG TPA: hypothetical protein VGK87_13730 [Anaerolineae bacterium]|jgi:septal ring factor EnvC (AmiA/AmiB activator)
MASINYEKEWLRIATRLEWTLAQLTHELEIAQTDDERQSLQASIKSVKDQIDRAQTEADRFTTKRKQSY